MEQKSKQFSATVVIDGNGAGKFEAHTNHDGDGLWIDDKQVIGTCDFHVNTQAAFNAKLRRRYGTAVEHSMGQRRVIQLDCRVHVSTA